MSDPVLAQRITDLLEGLGETADAVAESLRTRGIRGYIANCDTCPIARLIEREVPELDGSFVIEAIGVTCLGGGMFVRCPDAVADFIRRFDRKRYPDLIEERTT